MRGGTGGDGSHDRGPQDGGLGSGDRDEQDQHTKSKRPTNSVRDASQKRPRRRQRERDVLPAHRKKVPEAASSEVVGQKNSLRSVVAENESGVQSALIDGKGDRAPPQRPPNAVRKAVQDWCPAPRSNLLDGDPSCDVAGIEPGCGHRPRLEFAANEDALARKMRRHITRNCSGHPCLVPPPFDPNVDAYAEGRRDRIVDQGGDAFERADARLAMERGERNCSG